VIVAADAPRRPALRYFGGKWRLAKWIISRFPPHQVYVEPYGGGASVLLRKPRSRAEIYNDIDGEIVNFFRVLRDPELASRLEALVEMTPFARDELELAYEPINDPVEQARRTAVKSLMGYGTNAIHRPSGFRSNSTRSGTTPATDWMTWPAHIEALAARLRGVVIENRDALTLIDEHDSPRTLFYFDPPYFYATRPRTERYSIELSDDGHLALLARIQEVEGMVVLSGYASDLYDDVLEGWRRDEMPAMADGARPRTEVLWMNFEPMPLFRNLEA